MSATVQLQSASIQEPPMYIKEVYVDPTVAITTTQNQVPPKKLNSYGHIAAIEFDFTLSITIGTGVVAAVPAQNAITNLTIRDNNNKEILSCNGIQLSRMRKVMTLCNDLGEAEYRKGEYDAGTNITSTGGVYRVELPINVPLDYQQISYEYTMGVLSDILGTVGTATATATTRLISKSFVAALTPEQERLAQLKRFRTYTFPALTSGQEESYQSRLLENSMIYAMAIDMTADANLTDTTFKSGGIVGFDKLLERHIQTIEARNFDDGHTPVGFYVLPVNPTQVTPATEFKITAGGAVTPQFYQVYKLPGEK